MSDIAVLMLINTTGLQYDDRLRKEAGSLQAVGARVAILALESANLAGRSVVYEGVPAKTVRLHSRRWFPQGRGVVVKTAEMYLRFFANVVTARPDVVWCHDLEMGGIVPLLAVLRALGIIRRIVWDQHELPSDGLCESRWYRRLFGSLVNRCDSLVMANQERRALALEWLSGVRRTPIDVLNNYPDTRFRELPRQQLPAAVAEWLRGAPYVLAQGGANPDRHLDNLVASVVRIRRFKLVVVGPYISQLLADLQRTHGSLLADQILFTGPVPQMDLAQFIDHAYASIILYRADSANTRLCAPNRLYQALVRGVPVIVGANQPMADLVNAFRCGVVLQSDGADIKDLCDGLRRIEAGHETFAKAAAITRDLTWESQNETVARIAGARRPASVKTVCLLPVASDARIQRRLTAFARFGVEPTVLAFDRPYYPGKPIAGGYESLGRAEHGRYFSRLVPMVSALPKVRTACATADVVYAFSLDLLALAWLATRAMRRKPRFVYEVADIHPTLVGRGLRASIMRAVERKLLSAASLLVVTSEAFITGFYKNVQGITNLRYQLVENKPELAPSSVSTTRASRKAQDHLTIGYFGVIRCERSWRVLRRLADQSQGRIRIYLRGVPLNIPNFEAEAVASSWIEYGGPYVAPDELQAMYDRVDLVWIAHRVDEDNSLLWNRTNRFYESCAFQRPMIAQAGTQDGAVVLERGLGPSIDLAEPESVVDRVMSLCAQDIERWRSNVSRLPRSVYQENGEHAQLTARIRALADAV